jgi:hypothetical protein
LELEEIDAKEGDMPEANFNLDALFQEIHLGSGFVLLAEHMRLI